MKINFKKIGTVLGSALMVGATVGMAAATTYPAPFVENGAANVAIVVGSNAALSDAVAATSISSDLASALAAQTATGGSTSTTTVSGEAKAVETSSQPLYLGDYMNGTKETFSKDQLPTLLASGKVTDDDGKEYTYELKLDVPNTKVIYGETPDNLAEPVVYVDFDGTSINYDFKIIFPTAVNTTKLTDEAITLFGKDYVFSGSTSDLTTSKVVLFEKSTPVTINDGESTEVEGHTISVAVEDSTTATITVDGVSESKTEGWSGKINGVDIYLKNVVGPNVAGSSRFVELYLNSNKLTLENGQEVTVGSEDIDGTSVSFTNSSGKVSEIDITVTPYSLDDSIKYLKKGDTFTDPVFGSVKFALVSLTPELEAEGYARELSRRIQDFRKKLGLEKNNDYVDRIKTYLLELKLPFEFRDFNDIKSGKKVSWALTSFLGVASMRVAPRFTLAELQPQVILSNV